MANMDANDLERLLHFARRAFPMCTASIDPPAGAVGSWFLDIALGAEAYAVEWRPADGFTVTRCTDDPAELDDGVDPRCRTYEDAEQRLASMMREGSLRMA